MKEYHIWESNLAVSIIKICLLSTNLTSWILLQTQIQIFNADFLSTQNNETDCNCSPDDALCCLFFGVGIIGEMIFSISPDH